MDRLKRQLAAVRPSYQGQDSGNKKQRPVGDAKMTALKAEAAASKQQVNNMRAACLQRMGAQKVKHDQLLAAKDKRLPV